LPLRILALATNVEHGSTLNLRKRRLIGDAGSALIALESTL
jgi:hypothetical protein